MFAKMKIILGTVAMTAALIHARPALAATVDLTSGEGASGTINGALFEFRVIQPAGTGVLGTFVRIQAKDNEQGYNTSGRPVAFDEKTDPHTHNLTFGEVPVVTRDGVQYLEFLLDINEPNSLGASLITLNELHIYTSPTGSQTTSDVSSLGLLRYDLDGAGDSQIVLDHRAAPGSGKTDMAALIPLSLFAGTFSTDFLYLYSAFSGSGAGFEEWAVQSAAAAPPTTPPPGEGEGQEPIPLPAALPMGLVLLSMLGCRRWYRGH